MHYTHTQLLSQAQFTAEDIARIMQCRGEHNRLGFAYQLAFVRLLNRFPAQEPLHIDETILAYASTHLGIDTAYVESYGGRQKTVSEHQEALRHYLGLRLFTTAQDEVEAFLLKEAYRREQTAALMARLKVFLKDNRILEPSEDTMRRLIQTQREAARTAIYGKVSEALSETHRQCLDALLETADAAYSPLHHLKQPPGNPSPASFLKLTETLERIEGTGILGVDMRGINNNFQRSLAHYARQSSIYRLKRLKEERRHAVLACFLRQLYQSTYDAAVRMHDKLMNKIYNKADKEIDEHMKKRRKDVRASLAHYRRILGMVLDDGLEQEALRQSIFAAIDVPTLQKELETIEEMLGNQYSDSFKRVILRFSYRDRLKPPVF